MKAALQEVETPLVCHSPWPFRWGTPGVRAYVGGITIQIEIARNNTQYNPNAYYAISFQLRAGVLPWDMYWAMIRDEDESVTDAYIFYRQVLWDST